MTPEWKQALFWVVPGSAPRQPNGPDGLTSQEAVRAVKLEESDQAASSNPALVIVIVVVFVSVRVRVRLRVVAMSFPRILFQWALLGRMRGPRSEALFAASGGCRISNLRRRPAVTRSRCQ